MATGGVMIVRVLWQTGLALLVFWARSGIACAHAVVIESSPKDKEVLTSAPREAVLRFNVRLEKSLTRLRLATSGGREIPLPAPVENYGLEASERLVIPLPRLGPGDYLLSYKVLSKDGHATSGVLHFSIVTSP